jgi:hypothetical protein
VILWIESQRTEVIAAVTFGLSYLVVVLILLASAAIAPRRIAADLKATTPVMLTPLSVIAALLIAFLANRVWTNLDRANSYVAQEATAIQEAISLADGLPADMRTKLRASIGVYLHFVDSEDWPAMAAGHANLRQSPRGLTEALDTTMSINPTTRTQEIVQASVLAALERAFEGRRNRILLSQGVISPVQWVVIILLDMLLLTTIAMVHIDRRITAAVNTFILSTAIAACLVLLMMHDRPFAAGGFTLGPGALREIRIGD